MCLLSKVYLIELSKLTLLKECPLGIRGGKRSWKESKQSDKWQQQLLQPEESKQVWPVKPQPQSLAKGIWFQYQDLKCEGLASDYLGWSIRYWSNQEWRSNVLHLDEQGVQTWLVRATSRLCTSSWRRGAWVEPGTSCMWGSCVTESHPQGAFFLSTDAGRVREHTERLCTVWRLCTQPIASARKPSQPWRWRHTSSRSVNSLNFHAVDKPPRQAVTVSLLPAEENHGSETPLLGAASPQAVWAPHWLALSLCRPGSLTDVVRKERRKQLEGERVDSGLHSQDTVHRDREVETTGPWSSWLHVTSTTRKQR